ncbi:serine/threonine-protein kinase UCN [Argentina anserina]|uniref:serine/threonine-protein kinase UCN n=1 Tax=Argentina anserina TaxID=57926 RepID=UPI00217681F1|nr:serine/threonine-protein kinase UCN [Potentilla anserina]
MEEIPLPSHFSPELDLDTLKPISFLGKGAMGTVYLVYDPKSDPSAASPFALKLVDKSLLRTKPDADRRARWEVQVLTRLSDPENLHPFLPSLLGSFECDEYLGWAVPYCSGGDLNALRHFQNDRVFSPAVLRFYLAEIVCALEHLHTMGLAYRDLKPENVLIQHSGHVTLTDFDLSRSLNHQAVKTVASAADNAAEDTRRKSRGSLTRWITIINDNKKSKAAGVGLLKKAKSARVSPVCRRKPSFSDNGERANSFVGTVEYVSPEILRGEGHDFAVDWWALGILAYECLYGMTPFKGKSRKETFRNVVTRTPEFVGRRTALTDLIERLLHKDPTRRLGYVRGACEIKEHEFFRGVRWDLLTEVSRAPFIPPREEDVTERTRDSEKCGASVRELLQKLRAPPSSMPPSPDCQFAEF